MGGFDVILCIGPLSIHVPWSLLRLELEKNSLVLSLSVGEFLEASSAGSGFIRVGMPPQEPPLCRGPLRPRRGAAVAAGLGQALVAHGRWCASSFMFWVS